VPIVYVLVLSAVLVSMFRGQPAEAITGVGFLGVGGLVYMLLGLNQPPGSSRWSGRA
jgi:hypothetical protein